MLYLGTLLLFAASLASAACDADNCLRALRATQIPGRLEASLEFCANLTNPGIAAPPIPSYASQACQQNQNANLTVRIASACGCIATATPTAAPSATNACASISQISAAQVATAPSATPTVPAKLAQECLNSVPLNKEAALKLVNEVEPYLEWQSDLPWLKDPPSTYFYPPHDPLGYLASVKAKLESDFYPNEAEFELDFYNIFAKAHDGHFVFYPDVISNGIRWIKPTALVSVSKDGTSLPQIYLKDDIVSSPDTASVVTQINGVDAVKYLSDFIFPLTFNQDADAGYNTLFYNKASGGSGGIVNGLWSTAGRTRYVYPGANTTYTFENGTVFTFENLANVIGDFNGVVDGPSFFRKFAPGAFSTAQTAEAIEEATPSGAIVPGYPTPEIILDDFSIGGYYLNGTGFEDVAVLSVLGFEPDTPSEFQALAETFFAEAKAAGKSKLVIDLSKNGGGYILNGYDLFRQLFPHIVQDGFSRIRESDTFNEICRAISDIVGGDFNPQTSDNFDLINLYETWFNYRYDYNITDQPFETFEAKYGPVELRGDEFTEILRWNFNDPLTTINNTFGIGFDITGYRSRQNFTQPFAAEDIIMLTDGYCASTCTLFSEMMRIQAGVKVIMVGGRPQPGPVQAIGGVKGAQILSFANIYNTAETVLFYANTTSPVPSTTALKKLSNYPQSRAASTGINLRDAINRDHVEDGLPGQFTYEEADCRIFYTPAMIEDVTALWKGAASAAFKGGKECVAGGFAKRDVVETKRAPVKAASIPRRRNLKREPLQKDANWHLRHGKKVIN